MDKGNKEKVIVPIVCLLLSITMWLYVINIENPKNTENINSVPVSLTNIESITQEGFAITPGQEFEATLKVSGGVKDIDKIKKENIELKADFQGYNLKEGKNVVPVNISKFPYGGVTVDNRDTLFIEVNLEPVVEKEFTIEARVETNLQNTLVATESVEPKTVKVSGAKSTIESIDRVIAYGQELELKESIVKKYPIKAIDKNGVDVENITFSIKEVEISIQVSEAISKKVPVNIKTIGELPAGITMKSITGDLKEVEIKGAQDEIDKIGYLETEPIDLSQINQNKDLKVVIYQPDTIKIAEGSEYVNVKIQVTKKSVKEFNIKYTVLNLPSDMKAKYAKDSVIVTVEGNEDDLNALKVSNIKATIDLGTFKESGSITVTPVIVGIGDNLKFTTEDVTVTLEKIIEPEPN